MVLQDGADEGNQSFEVAGKRYQGLLLVGLNHRALDIAIGDAADGDVGNSNREIGRAAGGPRFILRYLENSIPYVPGTDLSLDGGIRETVRKKLEAMGHRVIPGREEDGSGGGGNVLNSILIDPRHGTLWGGGGAVTW